MIPSVVRSQGAEGEALHVDLCPHERGPGGRVGDRARHTVAMVAPPRAASVGLVANGPPEINPLSIANTNE